MLALRRKNIPTCNRTAIGLVYHTKRIPSLRKFSSRAGVISQTSRLLCSAPFPIHPIRPTPSFYPYPIGRRQHSQSSDQPPMTDPTRPDLFYHILSPPTPLSPSLPAFGLSFLPRKPYSPHSSAIIGWLPAAALEGGEGQEAGLNDFRENRAYS